MAHGRTFRFFLSLFVSRHLSHRLPRARRTFLRAFLISRTHRLSPNLALPSLSSSLYPSANALTADLFLIAAAAVAAAAGSLAGARPRGLLADQRRHRAHGERYRRTTVYVFTRSKPRAHTHVRYALYNRVALFGTLSPPLLTGERRGVTTIDNGEMGTHTHSRYSRGVTCVFKSVRVCAGGA